MDGGSEDNPAHRAQPVTEGEFAGWYTWSGDPFEQRVGPFYYRIDADGRPRTAVRAEKRHMNGGGFMHGGCIMTLADSSLFFIARDAIAGAPAVTASFNADFVGKVFEGDLVECAGEVVKAGRSLVFVRGLVTVGETTVMSFSGVIKKSSRQGVQA